MTMVSGISTKLCEARLLSNACFCYKHFESLRSGRSCKVCDLRSFFEQVCKTKSSDLQCVNRKISTSNFLKSGVHELFPRFCWFLNEVEGLSKEEFMTALKKHSVVKSACNLQSGLYPCGRHLSDIACSCFALSSDVEPLSQGQIEEQSNNNKNNVEAILNESSDQQIVPLCVEATEEDSPSVQKCLEVNSSEGEGDNVASCLSSKLLSKQESVGVSVETVDSSSANKKTVDWRNNEGPPQESTCEVVTLSGESSSEDFSLHLEESSSNPGLQSSYASQLDCHGSEDDTAAKDMEEPSKSMGSNSLVSSVAHCSLSSNVSKVPVTLCDDDSSLSLGSLDLSSLISVSAAKRNSKSGLLDNDSSSNVSVVDSLNSPPGTSNEEDLMQNVSQGDNSVFESISSDALTKHSSMCTEIGSDSPTSIDETSAKMKGKFSDCLFFWKNSQMALNFCSNKCTFAETIAMRLLKSPPPFNFHAQTTPEDTDSSVEGEYSSFLSTLSL